jgi:heme oxygenase
LPAFPSPANLAEALGMLYVLEGSTLGGHVILRTLRNAGVDCAPLAFLDPYGPDTGRRWRDFLIVLEQETGSEMRRDAACKGAVLAFEHALEVLCGLRQATIDPSTSAIATKNRYTSPDRFNPTA